MTTLELLQQRYGGTTAALADICTEYLGMNSSSAVQFARAGTLPIPCHRLGSQKAPWRVSLEHLAELIDRKRQEALTDWENNQA